MKTLLQVIIIYVLLTACSVKELSPSDYIYWVEDPDNGLHKIEQIGELVYEVQYKPADYILCKTGELDEVVSDKLLDSLRTQYDSLIYFTIVLKTTSGKDPVSQHTNSKDIEEAALYYFQYNFQQDIHLKIADKDDKQYSPVLFHFERMYTINNAKVFLMAFDKTSEMKDNDLQLIIHSKYLTSGLVKFYFDKDIFVQQTKMKL
ncbi:hypothetical protein [Cytophaga hutchinsonii]|uniref:Lipoprotein n=1 Tax=Cytophaga hutchinsonii (strain ATCC 33406 / DSM 1761 / CIP 103989 / NBRC 15051 / NCIMB 9469 / D465) TaxID=269798 RepID=A0A6N4SVQ2_CYTH3|nr:hypothetical protein [Cytophaga hutchinsonii]ABG60450.1 hypothetical protein CHU_3210 [Cytophaga hutchinsonii ATCC 33406]